MTDHGFPIIDDPGFEPFCNPDGDLYVYRKAVFERMWCHYLDSGEAGVDSAGFVVVSKEALEFIERMAREEYNVDHGG